MSRFSPVFKLAGAVMGRRRLWRLGRAMYMHARNDVANIIATNGEQRLQRELAAYWGQRLHAPICLDVGANYGQWASSLLHQTRHHALPLTLVCCEPVPEIRTALADTLKSVGSEVLHIRPEALAAAPGTGTFCRSSLGSGNHHLGYDGSDTDADHFNVTQTTIPMLCADLGVTRLDLLKIDCEGFDLDILRGALPLLTEERIDIAQFEYNHLWMETRSFLRDVYRLIEGTPYQLGKVTPTGIELYPAWAPEQERYFEANYVLIHPRLLGHLTTRRLSLAPDNTYA